MRIPLGGDHARSCSASRARCSRAPYLGPACLRESERPLADPGATSAGYPVPVRRVGSALLGIIARDCLEVENVSLRHENLTAEELEVQRGLDRSWAAGQRALADPEFRAYLYQSIDRLNTAPPSVPMSKAEFLAQTEPLPE